MNTDIEKIIAVASATQEGSGYAGTARRLQDFRATCTPAAVIEMAREIQELRKDAARYQWLRERDLETIDRGGIFAGITPENVILNMDDLDAAIDAAMNRDKT